jgi:transcriptional regulator
MLILRTLARGPMHGYAIAKRIRETSGEGLEIEDGSLYPALNRLLVKELVAAEWGVSETGRRARFYQLTPAGRKQLEVESREFDRLVKAIQLVMRTA